jgi:hypothetical protein
LILMSENVVLIEKSFADAIAMIAAAEELSEEKRRHWTTSLRQVAKALDRPPEVIPARYSAVRADLISLHEVPAGLTAKTLQNHKSNTKSALLYLAREKGVPEYGAPLMEEWQALKAKIEGSLVRHRLSSLMRFCSANGIKPGEVTESVVERFIDYRSRCGKPADTAFQRLMARAWNANVGMIRGWPGVTLVEPPVKSTVEIAWSDFPEGLRREVDSYLEGLTKIRRNRKRPPRAAAQGRHPSHPPRRTPGCCPHGGQGGGAGRKSQLSRSPAGSGGRRAGVGSLLHEKWRKAQALHDRSSGSLSVDRPRNKVPE